MKATLCWFFSLLLAAGTAHAQLGPTQKELDEAARSTDWLMVNHDYAGQRFLDLQQITRENASRLRTVCIYQAGDVNRFASNPIVYKGVMYVTTGTSTIALDAATCRVKWRHDWKPKAKEAQITFRGMLVNPYKSRGAAIKDGKLVRSTSDSYLIALDIETGKLVWERLIASAEKYEVIIMAPLIVEDVVIAGPGISEFGVKGWIGAFRLMDGEPVWRFNTVPDDGEPGADTWAQRDARMRGGGGVWVTPSLDRKTGHLFVAVGNPVPDFHSTGREGENLYTAAMVVLDAKTGKLLWHRSIVPHDLHDWDLTVTSPLYETTIDGELRQIVTVGGKDGVLRTLDRATHRELYQVAVTTRSNADAVPTLEGTHTCPGVLGGMQWSAPALNPRAGVLFAPAVDWCGVFKKADELRFIPGHLYMGGSFTYDPVEKSHGWLTALKATTGEVVWRYRSHRPMVTAVTATSADLVFTGEMTGDFLVLDGRNGDVLYRFNTGSPLPAGVITYAVDGKQYVAAATGSMASFWSPAPGASAIIVFSLP